MKVLTLCCSKSDTDEQFWPVDKGIISEMKKSGHEITAMIYDKGKDINVSDYDLVFNLCDGFDDMRDEVIIPEMAKKANVPCTGNTAETILTSLSKLNIKNLLLKNNIPTPEFQVFETGEEELKMSLETPVIVKPEYGHASEGIEVDNVVFNEEDMRKMIKQVMEENKCKALVERFIPSREFCIPMLGNSEPEALPMLEIDFPENLKEGKPKMLSYKAKWSKNSNLYKNTDSFVAAKVDEELKKKIENAATGAFKALGCRGYATADVRVDENNNVYVIDVNPNCYIAGESDFVKAAAVRGMDHSQLLVKMMELALH
ncbi:MAG: ATP-grasp domain-containing protein [Nanoarchaeota archaeon]|nr:ATP-grasp domain-containing protein [Nanoarchaeota archaeon]